MTSRGRGECYDNPNKILVSNSRSANCLLIECKNTSVPFHLAIFPLLFNLKRYEFHDVEDGIIRFANGHQIPVYSLTPGFLGEEDHSLWVANNDQHPTKKGIKLQPKDRSTMCVYQFLVR